MEAEVLRLILLALGAVLVVGIFLWDRYKRSRTRLKGLSARKTRKQPVFTSQDVKPEELDQGKSGQGELPYMNLADDEVDVPPMQLTESQAVPEKVDEPEKEIEFNALDEEQYERLSPEQEEQLPRMMIQIGLISKKAQYRSEDIYAAMKEVGLRYGDMGIYHRYQKNTDNRVLFSVASMVEPGQFPKSKKTQFETPGLLMFTQLPGVEDGLAIYSDMLYTAERMLALLGGTLQDETHSALSKQQVEHTRDLILEHRRQVQLARMK